MTHDLILPELGENVTSGTVVAVLVKVDDVVELEQTVIEIETDKAVAEVPADAAGRVTAIYVQEGQEIKVGAKLLSLKTGAEAANLPKASGPAAETDRTQAVEEKPAVDKPHPQVEKPVAAGDEPENQQPALPPDKVAPAAPSVRRFAREIGIDINAVPGSGPGGP